MKTAVLNQDVKGNFATWNKGTRVKVKEETDPATCTIERLDDAQGLALMDVMCCVPVNSITLEEIYGYRCEIELNGNDVINKNYVGSEKAVRRKCMMVTRSRRVVSMEPYTRAQWNAAFGNPDIRSRFC